MEKVKDAIYRIIKKHWKSFLLYGAFLVIMFIMIYQKENYHLDEFLTMNLANADEWLVPVDGVKYEPVMKFYQDGLTSDGTVDFSHVWEQQSNDTHPPFYYALIHLLCSLFPGVVSKRSLWIVNVFFQLLILFFYRKIFDEFELGENYKLLFSVAYILCGGVHAITTFFRMYVMLTFFVTLFTYLVLKCIKKITPILLIEIGVTTVCGTLTQYYFLIYAFGICTALVVYLLVKKRWAGFLTFSMTMMIGLATSYLIFPSIIKHLFVGSRGSQSLANLGGTALFDRLKQYLGFISDNLFGGLLALALGAIISVVIISFQNKREGCESTNTYKDTKIRLAFLGVSLIFYTILVAKSSPLITARYISPVYPIALIAVLVLIKLSLDLLKIAPQKAFAICLTIVGVFISCGFSKAYWDEFLYTESAEQTEWAENNAENTEAICLYTSPSSVNLVYLEAIRCKSITFYNISDYSEFSDKINIGEYGDEVALFLLSTSNPDSFVNQFLNDNPEFCL